MANPPSDNKEGNRPMTDYTQPPLTFVYEDDLDCPHFRCAGCGEAITGPANAVFERDAQLHRSGRLAVYHKRTCDPRHIAPWQELHHLIINLAVNSGVPPSRLRDAAAYIESEAE
jgi:hypothetical protein